MIFMPYIAVGAMEQQLNKTSHASSSMWLAKCLHQHNILTMGMLVCLCSAHMFTVFNVCGVAC